MEKRNKKGSISMVLLYQCIVAVCFGPEVDNHKDCPNRRHVNLSCLQKWILEIFLKPLSSGCDGF